jgi:hypothetical protein
MKVFTIYWREQRGYVLVKKRRSFEAFSENAAKTKWKEYTAQEKIPHDIDLCIEEYNSELFDKHLHIEAPDGYMYKLPVEFIARNHAEHFADKEYGGDRMKSLVEGTVPLFERDSYKILDWALNAFNWEDVVGECKKIALEKDPIDYQSVWLGLPDVNQRLIY